MSISVWNLGSVEIYPNIVVESILNLDETIEKILVESSHLIPTAYIWKKNTFCSEVNGSWNRIISFKIDNFKYHYMIRIDSYFNSTYGCPFYNREYEKECPFSQKFLKDEDKNLFLEFEKIIFKVFGQNTKRITEFPI
jgi:hypothetical protein